MIDSGAKYFLVCVECKLLLLVLEPITNIVKLSKFINKRFACYKNTSQVVRSYSKGLLKHNSSVVAE